MQNDEMIWQVINHQFCSHKTTLGKAHSDKTHFCRHPYSVTGLCNRTSCPLANSQYATIRETAGRVHLYMKSVERAHSPKNLWEKVLLSRNYSKAIAQLDDHLRYFPAVQLHRNKQRLTKIHQYLIRMRKIELKARSGRKAAVKHIHRKIEQREERRERKALVAAKLERNIERELTERLAKGTYGDIYNFPEMPYQKAMEKAAADADQEEEEEESTMAETEGESIVSEEEEEGMVEYVEDLDSEEEEEEDMEDMEDMGDYLGNGQWGMSSRDGDDDDEDGSDDDDGDSSEGENSGSSDDASSQDDEDAGGGGGAAGSGGRGGDDDGGSEKPPRGAKRPPQLKGDNTGRSGRLRRQQQRPRIEIEYEEEREDEPMIPVTQEANAGTAW